MRITLKLFASLSSHLPHDGRDGNAVQLEVPAGATISTVIEPYNLPPKLVHLVLVNGVYIDRERRDAHALQEGDVLAIWPPIAGG